MKIKQTTAVFLFLLCVAFAPLAQAQKASATDASKKLNTLLDNYFEDYLRLNPTFATGIGDNRYDNQFENSIGKDYRTAAKKIYAKYLKELAAIPRNQLPAADQLSFDVFKFYAETSLAHYQNRENLIPVNQNSDPTSAFALLASGKSLHPFKTIKNYEDFLGRIQGFKVFAETAIENMREGIAKGIVQPRIVMERKLSQLAALLVPDIKKSLFYQPINNFPTDFSTEDKVRLTTSYTQAINGIIYPSYQKLHDFIKNEYLPKTRSTVGFWAIPDGKEYYALRIKRMTTTNLMPEEIHQLGLSEVRRIRGEMETIKNQVGFKGDLKAFFDFVRSDKQFYPFNTAQEILDAYWKIETKLQGKIPQFFSKTPKTKFEIRQTEKFREATAAHAYAPGSPDGSRPGIFYAPIPNPKNYLVIQMESMFLHEAIPGHHFQISLSREQQGLPKFRNFYSNAAYTEGWGLYTEGIGKELGFYTDPYQYFGMLSGEMHRAIRLVVDTGMHAKKWTREQAITYSLENEPMTEANIIQEIERYIANPGQALAYKIGQLQILELRHKAERELGAKFSIKDFHDKILQDGALPMIVLGSNMNDWIARQKQK